MATIVWPTYNDVGTATGQGSTITESAWNGFFGSMFGLVRAGVVLNMTVSNPSGLVMRVSSGDCMIRGYWVATTHNIDVTLPDGGTYYVYLALQRDGSNNVTGLSGTYSASINNYKDQLLVARATTSGGSVTSWYDERASVGGVYSGIYTGNGTSNRDISADDGRSNRVPAFVMICNADAATDDILAFSTIEAPGYRITPNARTPQVRVYFEPQSATIGQLTTSTKTWNASSIGGGGGSVTSTISITHSTGDFLEVMHTDSQTRDQYDTLTLTWYYSGTNLLTAKVVNNTGSPKDLTGTLKAYKTSALSSTVATAHFLHNDSTSTKCPLIMGNNFRVSGTLNQNSVVYSYLSVF